VADWQDITYLIYFLDIYQNIFSKIKNTELLWKKNFFYWHWTVLCDNNNAAIKLKLLCTLIAHNNRLHFHTWLVRIVGSKVKLPSLYEKPHFVQLVLRGFIIVHRCIRLYKLSETVEAHYVTFTFLGKSDQSFLCKK